ncbi:hypothetical protein C0Q70_10002 [Pomacea canaliculata]|uniref:SAM-dependent MTase RsmB/NOP-type domain-containing protein n=1 Tax=Pomacea canaliculata TaxID=400727 RepID=A0A2T7PBD0_POMCA|nr:hypothetical protein C0Q70_10002 [Pomacea canaliculata]
MANLSLTLDSAVLTKLSKSYPEEVSDGKSSECASGSLKDLLEWLAVPPAFSTLRVNTFVVSSSEALMQVVKQLKETCNLQGKPELRVEIHPTLFDCLLVHNTGPHLPQQQAEKEVIVDHACGMAVLRGADVFKQGIVGAPLYARCLRGFSRVYQGSKMYVGTGVALVDRDELFCTSAVSRGVGVQMSEALYHSPSLSDFLPKIVFPQNLPSIICGHVLGPRPGETILDMCAAPGGKTSHIAALMNNEGRVVALDKTADKVAKIRSNLENFCLTCVESYVFDARKACSKDSDEVGEPPYPPATFDRVLLDGPCSALGQRPAVRNKMTAGCMASFPKLQRMLLTAAVHLVREGGTLVYSTCSLPVEENEDQVAWVLDNFPALVLEEQTPHLGGCGLAHSSLSAANCRLVQRFDPSRLSRIATRDCNSDTIGFFIAKFRKVSR